MPAAGGPWASRCRWWRVSMAPASSICAGPAQRAQRFLGWLVLGAPQAPPAPFPRVPRVPCACSEETPPRTGPRDLQELDSLDSEKSLLYGPGSR